jgi:hypothetical protein
MAAPVCATVDAIAAPNYARRAARNREADQRHLKGVF